MALAIVGGVINGAHGWINPAIPQDMGVIPSPNMRTDPWCENVEALDTDTKYNGDGKILIVGTSQFLLNTSSGALFNTGHHTTELFVPVYHFMDAGFTNFDVATIDGEPMRLERWTEENAAHSELNGEPSSYLDMIYTAKAKLSYKLDTPMNTSAVDPDLTDYLAIFIPGGHGPLIEMHTDYALGALLRKAHDLALPIISLCHGLAALRSANLGGDFPFSGYEFFMFPWEADNTAAMYGYLPSVLNDNTDNAPADLMALGMSMLNDRPYFNGYTDEVHVDRELITGATNLASQNLSAYAVPILLDLYSSDTVTASEYEELISDDDDDDDDVDDKFPEWAEITLIVVGVVVAFSIGVGLGIHIGGKKKALLSNDQL